MGLYATVVLYPKSSTPMASKEDRHRYATAIVRAFIELGMIKPSAAPALKSDEEFTFATGRLESLKTEVESFEMCHYDIDSVHLTPAIGELVYCDTAQGWWGEVEEDQADVLAVPTLDITLFSKALPFHDMDGMFLFESSIVIEFGYGDARLSLDIHRVRDESHPLFERLRDILGSEMEWCVVDG